jgi:hypothetical protein
MHKIHKGSNMYLLTFGLTAYYHIHSAESTEMETRWTGFLLQNLLPSSIRRKNARGQNPRNISNYAETASGDTARLKWSSKLLCSL